MAQQGGSSRRGNKRRKVPKVAPGLASKLDQWQKDAQTRQQQHAANRGYQRKEIGKFERDKLETQFKGQEYVSQLNEVSSLRDDQISAATTYKQFEKEQAKVNKLNNLNKYEQDALEYSNQQKDEQFVKLKKEEQIESLLNDQVQQILGKSEWNKSYIADWMESILKATGDLLDKYLKDGVYKYCIDVNILKSTAIARQSDILKANTDYSFNLKIKNGFGVIVLINCHAFKIN